MLEATSIDKIKKTQNIVKVNKKLSFTLKRISFFLLISIKKKILKTIINANIIGIKYTVVCILNRTGISPH